jgi:ketosteroid isomerase-like protein
MHTEAGMSEQQNLDLVRRGYEAFGRGDIPGVLELLDEQIAWRTPGPADLPTAGERRGRAGAQEFFQRLSAMAEMLRFEPREFLTRGDLVVVLGDSTLRVMQTGRTVEMQWVHIFTVRDGRLVGFDERADMSALVDEIRAASLRT